MLFISTGINSLLKIYFTMKKQIWKFPVIISALSFFANSSFQSLLDAH